MKYKFLLGFLLFYMTIYNSHTQIIGDEIVYLTTMINNQVLQIEKLSKELEFLAQTYSRFDIGIMKDTLEKNLNSLQNTIVNDVVQVLALDSFLQEYVAITQSDISLDIKEQRLQKMRAMINDIQSTKLAENITQPIIQQHNINKWIQEKVVVQDSMVEQSQLLNVGLLEINKQLSQLLYETRIAQKSKALESQILEAERILLQEKANVFWGVNE